MQLVRTSGDAGGKLQKKIDKKQAKIEKLMKNHEEEMEKLKTDHVIFLEDILHENKLLRRDLGVDKSQVHYFHQFDVYENEEEWREAFEEHGLFVCPTDVLKKYVPFDVIKFREGDELERLDGAIDLANRVELLWRDPDGRLPTWARRKNWVAKDFTDTKVCFQICMVAQRILEFPHLSVLRFLGAEVDAFMKLPNFKWLRGLAGCPLLYVDLKWAKKTPGLTAVSLTPHWKKYKVLAQQFGTYVICTHAVIMSKQDFDPEEVEQFRQKGQPGSGLFHFLSTEMFQKATPAIRGLKLCDFKEHEIPAVTERISNLRQFNRHGQKHSQNCEFLFIKSSFMQKTITEHYAKQQEPVPSLMDVFPEQEVFHRPKKSRRKQNSRPSPLRKGEAPLSPSSRTNVPLTNPRKRKGL